MNHTHTTFPSRRRHDTAGRLLLIGLCLLGFLSLLIPAQAEEVVIYVHTDHLGNPIAYSNEQGVVIQREYYLPYGQALNPDNELDDDSAAFTGHVSDSDTGLVYMQARYYDPVTGRFLSTDPVTFSPDKPAYFNRYWYAGGNPYKYTDPDGQCFVPPVAVACAGAGLALLAGAAATSGDVPNTSSAKGSGFETAVVLTTAVLLNDPLISNVMLNESGEESTSVTDTEAAKPPVRGEPGSTVRGKKQTRRYDGNGNPQTDVEYGHEGEGGNPDEPHAHDWDPPGEGETGPGTRGGQREYDPESDPPLPRGFTE